MRHAVLETQSEFRNASAEEKLTADIPNVSTSSRVASPTISSSSTTAINGLSFTAIIPSRPVALDATRDRFDKQSDYFPNVSLDVLSFRLIYIEFPLAPRRQFDAQAISGTLHLVGNPDQFGERADLHFSHNLMTVQPNSYLTNRQLPGNLFVDTTGH